MKCAVMEGLRWCTSNAIEDEEDIRCRPSRLASQSYDCREQALSIENSLPMQVLSSCTPHYADRVPKDSDTFSLRKT